MGSEAARQGAPSEPLTTAPPRAGVALSQNPEGRGSEQTPVSATSDLGTVLSTGNAAASKRAHFRADQADTTASHLQEVNLVMPGQRVGAEEGEITESGTVKHIWTWHGLSSTREVSVHPPICSVPVSLSVTAAQGSHRGWGQFTSNWVGRGFLPME